MHSGLWAFLYLCRSNFRRFVQQSFDRPFLSRQASFNCWGGLDGRVMSAPVVPCEVQAEHGVMVPSLLGMSVRQSGEPADLHSGSQVEPFHP